jgi:tRNA1(Val) A37 N6-methylase TrmN6
MKVWNDVLGYNLKIIQDTHMFKFSIDSILLARFVDPNKSRVRKICDFGTNNAIVPLILSEICNVEIDAVEIQKEAFEIANENVLHNKRNDQINLFNEDIKEFIKSRNNEYDLILCNPPFFKVHEKTKVRKISEAVVNARHETLITLDEVVRAAAIGCKHKGKFVMIHIAERFHEVFESLIKNNFVVKRIQFVHSHINEEAKKIIVEADFMGNPGLTILPPLIAHESDGEYTDDVTKLFHT